MTSQSRSQAAEWRDLTIPDGQPPVLVHRFFVDPATRGVTTLVRFPAGWRRPVTGYYQVEEEALFLEGSFRMTALEYPGVTYAFFPAGYIREDSISTDGALSIASFGGRADWVRRATPVGSEPAVRIPDWHEVPVTNSAELGAPGRLLRRHGSGSTWIFESPLFGRAPADAALEVFSIADHSWVRVGALEPIPELVAPVYCRLRSSAP